jgi:hypothetical protein
VEQLPDSSASWAAQAGALLGVGGLGAILLKLIERIFARADRGDDVAAGLRAEMLRRLETLERQYQTLERRERESYQKAVRLEAENRALRNRYHGLVNWIAAQPGLPTPPPWLYEPVQGPTADEAQRRPATGDTP